MAAPLRRSTELATAETPRRGPVAVVFIDDEDMAMPQEAVAVAVAVRLRSLGALVPMLVVLIVDMRVRVLELLMDVLELGRIMGRPQSGRRGRGGEDGE